MLQETRFDRIALLKVTMIDRDATRFGAIDQLGGRYGSIVDHLKFRLSRNVHTPACGDQEITVDPTPTSQPIKGLRRCVDHRIEAALTELRPKGGLPLEVRDPHKPCIERLQMFGFDVRGSCIVP